MQTFLPYSCFLSSIVCLDYRRQGNQRKEAKQILDILLNRKITLPPIAVYMGIEPDPLAWCNHPAVNMWRGYEEALKFYYNVCIQVWVSKNYINNLPSEKIDYKKLEMPHWLGNEKFHASHRSNLLRKKLKFYGKYLWKEPNNLPYIWPKGKEE